MMTNLENNEDNKYLKKFIENVKELHDDDKKQEILKELIKLNEKKGKISVQILSEKFNYDSIKLAAFLEELILTGKLNALKKDEVIEFL
ncbi:MAG: hypothetical protein EAX96_01380 [Candidatus Lokiarchaeota archaeon]|nr:hypothetical protein [Candidatus Lokiarchaeota archaeon]